MKKSKRANGINISFSKQVPSMLLQNIVVPKHQSVIDAVQRKIRLVDKRKEKNRKINRISNKVAKHLRLLAKKQQLEICILLMMKQEDFCLLNNLKKSLSSSYTIRRQSFQSTRKNFIVWENKDRQLEKTL